MSTMEIPVLVNIELDRIEQMLLNKVSLSQLEQNFITAIKKGLRASLKTGNLLSGALYVDMDYYPDEAQAPLPASPGKKDHGYNVFPTVSGGFVLLQQQIGHILARIERAPIDDTVTQLNQTLIEYTGVGKQMQTTLKRFNSVLSRQETQALPHTLQQTLTDLQSMLQGFSPDSSNYLEIEQALLRMSQVLKQLEPLLQTLNEQPDALIFGTKESADPMPVKGAYP